MKSLALNLFQKILPLLMLLVLLLVAAAATVEGTSSATSATTASSASSSATRRIISARNRSASLRTTTPVPPSLAKPPQLRRRFSATTSSSTSTTTTKTVVTTSPPAVSTKSPKPVLGQRQRRLPLTRQQHAASSAAIMATSTSSKPSALISEATTLASTRLVRHVDATTPQANSNDETKSVRQHRSFQSNAASSGQSYEDVAASKHKNKAIQQRRHQERTSATTEGSTTSDAATRNQRLRTATNYKTPPSSSGSLVDSRQSTDTSLDGLTTTTPPQPGNPANIKLTTRHNQQTPKTPRMIQRLVAGHLQNTQNGRSNNTRITYSLPMNDDDTSALGTRNSPLLSSSYRHNKLNANIRIDSRATSTTTPPKANELHTSHNHESDYHDDDEALLDDSGDFDNWDNGILRLSAGAGKENTLKSKKGKDDSKKTLADQVKDGKYGLIEKELFRRPPKRPGVLSYLPNKEVPEDNERNYGGLHEEDIWLAEDHLLVIKGGSLNEDNEAEPWPAIDDYNAAGRQIKIPDNPKVPPPFPVQLEENGPVQLIGNNKLTVVYPVPNESLSVYTAGSEAHNASPESDRDDEKNLITRPGKTQDAQEKEPGYNYASPSLPWLSDNQTSGDSASLNNGKPINFPMLGPFLYGRNGSLDNETEDFDEDDPSLYYPPPYTFVYKSNYTNLVPPGPLVPGIVVPPPPDHFSKLEKPEKERRPSGNSSPTRYRVYSTTSTTPAPVVTKPATTTTTTTSTTTASPFRHSVTKISEYIPKVIHIANPSPRPVYSPTAAPAVSSRLQPTPPATPPPQLIEPVPVPVAVPIPVYSVNAEPNIRPGTISFVPTTPQSNIETFSKSNPIYYEYFEAKRQQANSHLIDEFLPSTVSPKPIKLYNTSKRPYKNSPPHHRNYLQPLAHNHRYIEDNVVAITPKPEVRHKQRPLYKQRPLQNFEQEAEIRDTLRYYQNQELRDNNIPRTPKAKPVFDYNYESVKSVTPEGIRNTFQPPLEFDVEPFQPMVTYSPAVGDDDAFKAVNLDKVDSAALQVQGREELEEQNLQQPKYVSTTTLVPVQQPERHKKLRAGAKYLQQPQQQHQQLQLQQYQQHQRQQYQHQQQQLRQYQQQQQQQQQHQQQKHQQNQDYNRWVAVNQKQEYGVYTPPETPPPPPSPPRERYQEALPHQQQQPQRNRDYPGYYYGPSRQNNRFYEEPFQNAPNRKIINYRPQPPPPPPPAPAAQQQLPQQAVWSLENDTYVNYAPNRPPLNPDAEFINPYQTIPVNTYQQQQQQQRLTYQQQPPQQHQDGLQPALSHQSQYYAPPPQRLPGRQYQSQSQAPVSLHRDILVNYRQPLPPINPDSEFITHPQVVRNPGINQFYRANPATYRLPPQQQPSHIGGPNLNIGGEADVYFLTPKFRRANNLNNNPSNRNHAPQGNNGK